MKEYKPIYEKGEAVEGPGMDFTTKLPDEYKWIAMIDRLSGGDITKHDEVYARNWRETLYLLSYWSERDKINKANELK